MHIKGLIILSLLCLCGTLQTWADYVWSTDLTCQEALPEEISLTGDKPYVKFVVDYAAASSSASNMQLTMHVRQNENDSWMELFTGYTMSTSAGTGTQKIFQGSTSYTDAIQVNISKYTSSKAKAYEVLTYFGTMPKDGVWLHLTMGCTGATTQHKDVHVKMEMEPVIVGSIPYTGSEALYLGGQTVMVSSDKKMKAFQLLDATSGQTINEVVANPISTSLEMSCKAMVTTTAANAVVVYPEVKAKTVVEASSWILKYKAPLTLLPTHAIQGFWTIQIPNQDSKEDTYLRNPYNRVLWSVAEPKSKDLWDGDMWVVSRAKKSDFSDAQDIATVNFSQPDTIIGKIGYYKFDDKAPEALYNENSKNYFESKVYYRVYRAAIKSIWPTHRGKYFCEDSLNLTNFLPEVSRVKISKTETFDTEKRVKVRIELDNDRGEDDNLPTYSPNMQVGAMNSNLFVNIQDSKAPVPLCRYEVPWKITQQDRFQFYRVALGLNYTWEPNPNGIDDEPYKINIKGVANPDQQADSMLFYIPNKNAFFYTKDNRLWGISNQKYEIPLSGGGTISLRSFDLVVQKKSRADSSSSSCQSFRMIKPSAFGKAYAAMQYDYVKNINNYPFNSQISSLGYQRLLNWDADAQIVVKRYSPAEEHCTNNGQDKDLAAKTYLISGSDVKWDKSRARYYVELEDVQSAPYIHYYYRAQVLRAGSHSFALTNDSVSSSEADANACWSEQAQAISSFSASEGTVEGGVQLKWDVDNLDNGSVKLERCVANTSNQKPTYWEDLHCDTKATEFFDETAKVGIVYMYRLTSTVTTCTKSYSNRKEVFGWKMVQGSISGKILMKGNGAFPAQPTVKLEVPEVEILEKKLDDRVMIPHYYQAKEQRNIDIDVSTGVFKVENLLYQSEGTKYDLSVEYGTASFTNPGGSTGTYTMQMSDGTWNWKNQNFICQSVKRMSGRVLYNLSTIPSEGVKFKFNGIVLVDINGKPITTDNLGNFAFDVPIVQQTIQAFKEGHTFADNGYIKDKQNNTTFTPTQDYEGLELSDLTTVRLIGRVTASEHNRNVPYGEGKSVNIIGENIRMELKLEGNNVAQIYYNSKDLEKTEDAREFKIGKTDALTKTSFEKRRILAYADTQTGEFEILVPPSRYKLTALSAQGYSTLLDVAQSLPVLDLTEVKDSFIFEHVYHGSVGIDCEQLKFGNIYNKFVGDEKVKCNNMVGETNEYVMASYDKKEEKVSYTFGYPVFSEGKSYQLRAFAYEKFYFNNDSITSRPVKVPFRSGKLIVRNGLKDGVDEMHADIDTTGRASFVVKAANPTFLYVGNEALRNIDMQVELNGYYYVAAPLKGYVMGSRVKENDVLNIGEKIQVLDILRDPPGAVSFATREKGTTYKWDYNYTKTETVKLSGSITTGPATWVNTGLMAANITHKITAGIKVPININLPASVDVIDNEYTMTLSDKISTSSDPYSQGAMADVYIGTTTNYGIETNECYTVVNDSVYKMYENAIKSGVVKAVAHGSTSEGKFHILIGETYTIGPSKLSTFVYNQKHILSNIIPNLQAKRDALIRDTDTIDKVAWQKAADAAKKALYFRCKTDTTHTVYFIPPSSSKTEINVVSQCNSSIYQWQQVIRDNEHTKVDALKGKVSTTYSLGQTTITHSEQASSYDMNYSYDQASSGGLGLNGGRDSKGDADENASEVQFNTAGLFLSFNVGFSVDWNNSLTKKYIKTKSCGYSYTLGQAQQGYMDVDVYDQISEEITKPMSDDNTIQKSDYNSARLHSHIFKMRSGASRAPWFDADTTLFYEPGTKLGERTLKIDNPRIIIDQPVVSNIPGDEKAYFSMRLANETELNRDVSVYRPVSFFLHVDPNSNQNGARLYIDGQPFTEGMQIYLSPGASITKTLEVQRGAAYDYNNIQLQLYDNTYTLSSNQNISVHYLPTSTPLNIVTPTDKWTMNTLSDKDKQGYFLPVEIGGFNVNYDNFDHIELQYKKHTEGESQWVNLCSYYVNDSLYQRASGKKEKISSGKISNIRFYGEQDPVEMAYDLRAVSFCRLGTGFVTRSSNVVMGMKDTRVPTIFGLPQPASGVWRYDDVIALNFSEDIAYNYLDKTSNFSINGYTNNTDQDYSSYLHCSGNKEKGDTLQIGNHAQTKVSRNLSNTSFSIDLMAKVDSATIMTTFMSQNVTTEKVSNAFVFGFMKESVTKAERLYAYISNKFFTSKPIDTKLINMHTNFVHVGMAYNDKDSTITFFIGDNKLDLDDEVKGQKAVCQSNDVITIGTGKDNFCLANVRLWSKALTANEFAKWRNKRLTGTEADLMAYWPMDETQGSVAKDLANGADIYLYGARWETMEGHSVHLDNKHLTLTNIDKFQRSDADDYTIGFWFKVDKLNRDSVDIFRAGHPNLADNAGNKLVVYAYDKDLMLKSAGKEIVLAENNTCLTDKKWHHFALVVNHTHNSVSAFIDGKITYSGGDNVGGVDNGLIRLGDTKFVGDFDKLCFWHLALPSDYIGSFYNRWLKGNEMELAVYLPFNKYTTNNQGTLISTFSGYNQAYNVKAKGAVEDSTTIMVADASLATIDHAPLRTTGNLQNFDFTWTATDHALQINVNKQDEEINHQKISITVRGVEDLNGNSMLQPQMWTVYAYRNRMDWTEKEYNLKLNYGEGGSMVATWENKGGNSLNYSLTTDKKWVKLSKSMGATEPLSKEFVTIDIDKEIAPGTYQACVNLKDENNLLSTLKINVVVTAAEPEWTVSKGYAYSNTMVMKGQVTVRNADGQEAIDMDSRDIIGVFFDGKCVGKEYLSVNREYNTSNIYLNIVGTDVMNKSSLPLDFRLWRASTGEEVILNATPQVLFRNQTAVGCGVDEEPVALKQANTRVQRINFTAGWNWVSLNVIPKVKAGANGLFMSNKDFTSNDRIKLYLNGFYSYDKITNLWAGDASQLPIRKGNVYQFYAQKDGQFSVIGEEFADTARYVTFKADAWNELPYLLNVDQPINIALSGYMPGDKAAIGTIIKDHDRFAIATKNGWVGSLEYLTPGHGYYVKHQGPACVVKFTNTIIDYVPGPATPSLRTQYNTMMPIVATLADSIQAVEGDELVAYVGNLEVGRAPMQTIAEGQRFFLAVNADEYNNVTFALERNGEPLAKSTSNLTYGGDLVAGSVERPYPISFEANDLGDGHYYTIDGKYLGTKPQHGINISKNAKILR